MAELVPVPDLTVRPDGTIAMPSDYDRLRRAYATDAGIAPTTPLPQSAEKMVGEVRSERLAREAYYSQNDMPSELDLALRRYVPIPQATPFTPQEIGPPTLANPPTGTFLEGLKTGFRKDTLLGSIFEHQERRNQIEAAVGPIKPVEGYSVWEDPQTAPPEIRSQMWRYVGSQSAPETALRILQYNERTWDNMAASQAGGAFNVGRVLGGFTDPTLLLTSELGLATKSIMAMRAAGHAPIWGRIARGIEIGSINVAQSLGIEAARNAMDPSYTAEGLGDMMLLAGGIGFGAGVLTRGSAGVLHLADPATALRWDGHGNYQKLLRSAPEHPLVMDQYSGGYAGRTGDLVSAGAAATPYMAASHYLAALEGEGLKSIFGAEKFGLNPVMRGLAGSSLVVRETMAQLADLGGLKQNKNVDSILTPAQKTAFPAEAEIAVRWKAKASTVEQEIRSAWLAGRSQMSEEATKEMAPFLKEQLRSWLSKDGKLSFGEFDQRVGRAVANGNIDKAGDAYSPFIEKAARHVDGLLKEHKAHADQLGMFKTAWQKQIKEGRMELAAVQKRGGEARRIAQLEARLEKMERLSKHGPQVNTSPNYFPRMHRHDEMAAREDEWLARVENYFVRGGMTRDEASKAAAAAHSEITLSNFRPIVEDNGVLIKAASDPGSLKFRTLEIPDDEIEDFLDWSAVGAVRHQTATMAPAIELTRRYGDASMTEVLKEIQSEYEGLIAKANSGARRVELQNEMKQALDDVQAIRDRLLNVAGASKDPHSWNERTIRMLKHYTAWTTLGLSAVSQMGDLFRPAITEGLDAVHRYGFLTLMDASRAEIMKMAQRERMMAGDANELATGAAALAFSNIGDTFHSRSRLERQANQLSGAYFMLNGLTFTTDMTKRWGGLVVQGNLNAEIMKWGGYLEAEARFKGTTIEDVVRGQVKAVAASQPESALAKAERERVAAAGAVVEERAQTGTRLVDMEFTSGQLERAGPSAITSEQIRQDQGLTEVRPNQLLAGLERGKQQAYVVMPDGRIFEIAEDFSSSAEEARRVDIGKYGSHAAFFARYEGLSQEVIRLTRFEDSIAASHPDAGRTAKQDAVLRRMHKQWEREGKGDKVNFGLDESPMRAKEAAVEALPPAPPSAPQHPGWNDMAGTPIHEQAVDKAVPPDKLMLERLHSLSIDANDALAIYQMLKTHGKDFKSIRMANSDEWTDKDAQMLYRGALGRAINRTVVTPGVMDRPTWMTTSIGSLIGQFKTFGVSSMIRTLGAGLQDNDRQFWTGAATLVGSGIVLNELRNQLFYDRSSFDQPYLGVLADGLDRSGVLGSLMDVNNAVETATNNKVGLRPMVGAGKNTPVSAEKFASTFFGPAAGKTTAAAKTLGEIVSGNADARTWRDMRGFVPGQNIPYVDPVADLAFPKPAPRQRKKTMEPVP